jgi:hypothetical protein
MTPSEWDACTEPQKTLRFLQESGRASERKLRLYACACCRQVGGLLDDRGGLSRFAVEAAERYADGAAGLEELGAARAGAEAAAERDYYEGYGWCYSLPLGEDWPTAAAAASPLGPEEASRAASGAVDCARDLERLSGLAGAPEALLVGQCILLRDIIGNPFRPRLRLSPSLLTPTVLSLAKASYDERIMPLGHLDPVRLAVLADALEEVRCADEGVLGHLRSAGPHVRGCHVVDAVSGRG